MSTNELTPVQQEVAIYNSLKSSLYPNASDGSIQMVLAYCKAAKIDPMLKAVHIVPMRGRDVVMPGIGFYRIQAERSGSYAGISEPEFGPMITEKLGGVEVTYPEWCKITVSKIVQGRAAEFVAKEYWIENYATKGGDSKAPNTMWAKRPKGQLAKCAEAQALRKAWPELLSAQPTAEEMEGKDYLEAEEGGYQPLKREFKPVNEAIKDKLKANFIPQTYPQTTPEVEVAAEIVVENQRVTDSTLQNLLFLVGVCGVPAEAQEKWLKKAQVSELKDLSEEQAKKIIAMLEEKNRE